MYPTHQVSVATATKIKWWHTFWVSRHLKCEAEGLCSRIAHSTFSTRCYLSNISRSRLHGVGIIVKSNGFFPYSLDRCEFNRSLFAYNFDIRNSGESQWFIGTRNHRRSLDYVRTGLFFRLKKCRAQTIKVQCESVLENTVYCVKIPVDCSISCRHSEFEHCTCRLHVNGSVHIWKSRSQRKMTLKLCRINFYGLIM